MKSEFGRGWRAVVSGAVGMGTGLGLYFMLNSVFVIPLSEEFGWERSEVAFSNVISLGALVLLPFLGAVVDRFDSRRVGLVGMFLLGLSYIALSLQPGQLWVYYLTLLLIVPRQR
jgi:MFS family permease